MKQPQLSTQNVHLKEKYAPQKDYKADQDSKIKFSTPLRLGHQRAITTARPSNTPL